MAGESNQRHSSDRAGGTRRRGKDQPCRGDAVRSRSHRPIGVDGQRLQHRRFEPGSRQRGGSTELNLYNFEYLGDSFAILDCPGSVGFSADGARALAIADVAIVVVDPDPARAPLAAPALRALDELGIPHLIFVNRIDQAHGRVRDLLSALQPMSVSPLIARQIPIWDGEKVSGFVDLALERAFKYRPGQQSERIEIPSELQDREIEARTHMLEQLADHDDELLEQLLMDQSPTPREGVSGSRPRNRRKPRRLGAVRFGKQLMGRAPAAEGAAPRSARSAGGRQPPRGRRPGDVRLQGHSRLDRPAGAVAACSAERSPRAPTSRPQDGDMPRVGSLFKVQGEKTQKVSEGARRRRRRGGQGRYRQGRPMARHGQAAAAGRDRLSGAQLRDRDRARRPQG